MPYKGKSVTVKFTVAGKAYYSHAKTRREAVEKAAIKKKEIEEGRRARSPEATVAEWCAIWLDSYKLGAVNDRHFSDLSHQVQKFLIEPLGTAKARAVTQSDLQAIINGMEKYSDSYRKKIYDIIRQVFKAALQNDVILKDPAAGLKLPRARGKRARRAITPFERELTLKTAETSRGGLFILIMLFAGLRPGEVAALQWSDIDTENGIIHVRHALKADGSIGAPKSAAGVRDVPIPPYLLKRLEPGSGLVCTNSAGGQYTKASITRMWKTFKREMEIEAGTKLFRNQLVPPLALPEDLTLYCYRHTYCTDLERAGVQLTVARRLMGHTSVAITAETYTHGTADAFADAAEKIAKISPEVAPAVAPEPASTEK